MDTVTKFELALVVKEPALTVEKLDKVADAINFHFNEFMELQGWHFELDTKRSLLVYTFEPYGNDLTLDDETAYIDFVRPHIIEILGEAYAKQCSPYKIPPVEECGSRDSGRHGVCRK